MDRYNDCLHFVVCDRCPNCNPTECEFFLPEADVVEVRHGEWIMRGGRFRCSECDGKALMQDVGGTGGFSHEFEQVKSDICPHCGAKMDGKDGE